MEEIIQLVLIEDDPVFVENVKSCLSDHPKFRLIKHFTSCEDALNNNILGNTDILLLDIQLPGMNGLEAIPQLLNNNPDLNIIILTCFNHDEKLFTALQEGAKGYLLKSDCFRLLENAITEVSMGGMLFSPEMAKKVLSHFKRRPFAKTKLTKREKEVLQLLKDGHSKKYMADYLQISYGTVDTHVKNIYKKLQVNSNVQAARAIAAWLN